MIKPLGWGLSHAVPDDAVSAWGARLIVTQDGTVDIVHDRVDRQGSRAIFDQLATEFPSEEFISTLADLLKSHIMQTRKDEPFVLYQSDTLVVVANTNASGGYCYVAAWTTLLWFEKPSGFVTATELLAELRPEAVEDPA